ncbi:MAG: DUF1588 domain-containing protein [Planctomycetes bacterium]|nr:DUF1588 domain-containing protein [Planctomycetota bacterium]
MTWQLAMRRTCLLLLVCGRLAGRVQAGEFDQFLKPLLGQKCVQCHGEIETNAQINFQHWASAEKMLDQPAMIKRALTAIDTGAMPPEGEPALDDETRTRAVAALKGLLREASDRLPQQPLPLRRLNRFQYNNTVRDLFALNRDLFPLPEKLMTRYDSYLQQPVEPAPRRMPDTINVASHSLAPLPGLQDVKPFPKDLRAEHGFDNQADQLTMSPLLLDTFLRLSVSIVESPDFNDQTVGIWKDFFAEPAADVDRPMEVRRRLSRFLPRAFRRPVDDETLGRYAAYGAARLNQGLSFTDTMRKVASAVLSSPRFLYRTPATDDRETQFEFASHLSYFLWASCPDDELLTLAERGELKDPQVLHRTVDRMLADPRIERFLDAFPAQWMQLENLLAVTPDPQINKYFSLDRDAPASLQMILEPLLLFDTVFVEDRSIVDLIAPKFSYQSRFLQTWYTTDLKPPAVDTGKLRADNQRNDEQRKSLQAQIATAQTQLNELIQPVRTRLLEARREKKDTAPIDLKPYAVWEFEGDLKDSAGQLDLTAHGDISLRDGMVVLDRAFLQSKPLAEELRAKTLEVRFRLSNLDQRGGGLMGIQGPGDFFDTIVIGERKNRHWISGSNGFARTEDFPESLEETRIGEDLHLAMVYTDDGTTTLYRNGQPYGQPYRKGMAVFPREQSSVIFGLRHLPAGGNRYLSVNIDQARLYNRALTAEEVAAAASGHGGFVSEADLLAALTPRQKGERQRLTAELDKASVALKQVPANLDPDKAILVAQQTFEYELRQQLRSRVFQRVAANDPRYGGIITNAAMLSMTSGPKRTHPVARGVWIIEAIFNAPPPPPPNDVPPLDEESGGKDLTIREQFAAHRQNPSCAGCHTKLDPLGFAMENFDITGRWRDQYDNGRKVDASGSLLRNQEFEGVVQFKELLVRQKRRFATAFTEHLLRFALTRELGPADSPTVDEIVNRAQADDFQLRSVIQSIIASKRFQDAP